LQRVNAWRALLFKAEQKFGIYRLCTLHLHRTRTNEGNGRRSLLFFPYSMAIENQIRQIEQLVDQVLAEHPEYFRTNVKIKPTNNVKVFIDGDNGVTIEKCVFFNRQLYKLIEESGMYPEGEFSLEVSSHGVTEPLTMHRQYVKNTGRDIEVIFNDGSKKEGKLLQVAEADIILEQVEGKGKKSVTQQLVIPFDNIKSTTVQVKF
jgi:ribosome maturation factor RimP